jgi:hypothetical protein
MDFILWLTDDAYYSLKAEMARLESIGSPPKNLDEAFRLVYQYVTEKKGQRRRHCFEYESTGIYARPKSISLSRGVAEENGLGAGVDAC